MCSLVVSNFRSPWKYQGNIFQSTGVCPCAVSQILGLLFRLRETKEAFKLWNVTYGLTRQYDGQLYFHCLETFKIANPFLISILHEFVRHCLKCRKSVGRFSRNTALNDLIKRPLQIAEVPPLLEPVDMSRGDNLKSVDGVTNWLTG